MLFAKQRHGLYIQRQRLRVLLDLWPNERVGGPRGSHFGRAKQKGRATILAGGMLWSLARLGAMVF